MSTPAGTNLTAGMASIGFGAQSPGRPSAAKVFTIRNLGTSDLTITAPAAIGGNAGDFNVNNTGLLLTIPAGQQTNSASPSPPPPAARAAPRFASPATTRMKIPSTSPSPAPAFCLPRTPTATA